MKKSWKIVLTSVIIWLVGTVFAWLTCGWLFNKVYTIPPLIWLSPEAMFTATNMFWSNFFGLAGSFVFVLVYLWIFKGIPGKNTKKGMNYGLIVWLVGTLFGIIGMPLYMTISWIVVIYWIIQALVFNLIRGAIVGAMFKKA